MQRGGGGMNQGGSKREYIAHGGMGHLGPIEGGSGKRVFLSHDPGEVKQAEQSRQFDEVKLISSPHSDEEEEVARHDGV